MYLPFFSSERYLPVYPSQKTSVNCSSAIPLNVFKSLCKRVYVCVSWCVNIRMFIFACAHKHTLRRNNKHYSVLFLVRVNAKGWTTLLESSFTLHNFTMLQFYDNGSPRCFSVAKTRQGCDDLPIMHNLNKMLPTTGFR